jgi:DNA-directed RNA polymerase subunit RPC12/RpoP
MDLFSITCTTCKSRLRVRDQAAIGQILACPKCGGMVMVKPPPAFSEQSEQRSDLPTATEVIGSVPRIDQTVHNSAFDALEDLLSDSPPKVQPPPRSFETPAPPPSQSPSPKPRFVGGPPAAKSAAAVNGGAKSHATPPAAAVPSTVKPQPTNGAAPQPAPPRVHDSASLKPPPPGESAAAAGLAPLPATKSPRRYWLHMGAAVALGVVLAFAAVVASILFLQPTGRTSAKSAPRSRDVSPPTSPAKSPQLALSPADSQPNESVLAPAPSPAAASPTVAVDSVPSPASSGSAAPSATDPLELVKAPPAAPAKSASGDPLAKFDRILGGAGDDPLAKSTAGPGVATPPLTDSAPARPLAPRPPPRDVDVARRLADPLPGIESTSTPLADFVQLMSDLSTIPMTLELPFPPATAGTSVALRLTNTTVGKALKEALTPLRLEFVVSNDQLVVRREEPNPAVPFSQDVKDLTTGDEAQMTELADLLKAVVEPGAWGEDENSGSISVDVPKSQLVIRHRRNVQGQLLAALEKLRTARKLDHKWKLDPALFQLDSRSVQARPRLEQVISLNYTQPTRLVTILQRLGEAAGVRILVDWHDVAAAGWNPAGEATLIVSKQPLAAALDALLGPLDLTWRVIDAQTLQVVTPARLAEQGELELYNVADLAAVEASGDALIFKIQAALGDSAFTSGGGSGEVRYETESKCLLAWLPQPKQRDLEALLAKWRTEKAK